MKFSVSLSTGFEGLMNPIGFSGPEDFYRQALRCEALGFDSVWGNEHFTTQSYVRKLYPGQVPNFYEPMMVMAALAGVTQRLRLGTALTVLPMHDPVVLIKQALTLDRMSGGRFIMAVGLGAYREEFLAWGGARAAQAHRGAMMDEGLEAIHLLLTERSATFKGRYYDFEGIEMAPKSIRQPFPLWVGGHNMEALRRAARYGSGWIPAWRPVHEMAERIATLKREAEAIGRDPAGIEIAPQFSVTVGRTMEEAERRHLATGLVAHRQSLAYTGRDLSHQVLANLVGSPEVILQKIEVLRGIGVDHCCALMFPTDSVGEMDEQIEWFATEVMARVPGWRMPAVPATGT